MTLTTLPTMRTAFFLVSSVRSSLCYHAQLKQLTHWKKISHSNKWVNLIKQNFAPEIVCIDVLDDEDDDNDDSDEVMTLMTMRMMMIMITNLLIHFGQQVLLVFKLPQHSLKKHHHQHLPKKHQHLLKILTVNNPKGYKSSYPKKSNEMQ